MKPAPRRSVFALFVAILFSATSARPCVASLADWRRQGKQLLQFLTPPRGLQDMSSFGNPPQVRNLAGALPYLRAAGQLISELQAFSV